MLSLLLLISITVLSGFELVDGIMVLNKTNFEEAFNAHQTMVVMFHAPSCHHCTKLSPTYVQVASELKDSGVGFAKVDVSVEVELMQRYDI